MSARSLASQIKNDDDILDISVNNRAVQKSYPVPRHIHKPTACVRIHTHEILIQRNSDTMFRDERMVDNGYRRMSCSCAVQINNGYIENCRQSSQWSRLEALRQALCTITPMKRAAPEPFRHGAASPDSQYFFSRY